jgi:transposase
MFGFGPATRIYVALGATDMRKGFDGLYGIVRDKLGLEVTSGHLFLFTNARRNRLKILLWDGSGADTSPKESFDPGDKYGVTARSLLLFVLRI